MRMIYALILFAACGDNLKPAADAGMIDASRIDAVVDGPCAAGRFITGELVDIDSTNAALFGINAAVFTQRGGAATDTTPPNGRFEMCAASTTTFLFDVDSPPTHVDGIAYFEVEALADNQMISFRTWTLQRAATFYTSLGLTYDPAKAHLLIFQTGDVTGFTIAGGSYGTVQAGNGGETTGAYTWAAGGAGRYVLVPNVDPTAASISIIGDTSGQHTVPVAAGKISFAALHTVFL